jgi:hypothetical protein
MVLPIPDVAWWLFQEGTGTTAADSTGNGVTMTLSSSAGWTSGDVGNAYDFGSSYHGAMSLTYGASWTFNWWCNLVDISATGYFLRDVNTGSGVYLADNGRGFYFVAAGFSSQQSGSLVPSTGAWNMITMSNNAGNITIYINASADPTVLTNGGADTVNAMSSAGVPIDGAIQDFEVYSTALTSTQISALYANGPRISAGPPPSYTSNLFFSSAAR